MAWGPRRQSPRSGCILASALAYGITLFACCELVQHVWLSLLCMMTKCTECVIYSSWRFDQISPYCMGLPALLAHRNGLIRPWERHNNGKTPLRGRHISNTPVGRFLPNRNSLHGGFLPGKLRHAETSAGKF